MTTGLRQAVEEAKAEANAPAAGVPSQAPDEQRMADLAEIIAAYNEVTVRLQKSHETLQDEVNRLREELASTNAQLQRSKRLSALGEMAAGIAHEIRNPLAAIQLYAQMIVDDLADSGVVEQSTHVAESGENAERIGSAVRGLSAIVNDVLTFARQATPECCEVSVAGLLQRVIEATLPALEEAGVELVCDIDPGMTLLADSGQLQQAVANLVRNAAEAMAGREARTLTLSAQADEAGVILQIADTGPGIDDEVIDRVFNPFFTTRSSGTGLGLAIVHRIVDAHGGTISVANDPATGGAVFRIALPREAAAVASASEYEASNMPSGAPSRASAEASQGVAA